ncbi:DUF2452 domain-containing protein [Polluticaenibacter yanchengensis]|uniref:DUF2452 domain-containing protein n=1 Tax=Polluticaenibacter yanchengensis TaxID=3014562 RepID=A0ABT4UJC9_9BACT|nr:DUF2452 domain-containing protein [Chitinophagaceae bacterium LY-5]
MVKAYNYLASWQLFPEKCIYESGTSPKSGYYKIDTTSKENELQVTANWVSQENEAFFSEYKVTVNGLPQVFDNQELADTIVAEIDSKSILTVNFLKDEKVVLEVVHEIMHNGYLKVLHKGFDAETRPFTNTEIYHKQLSVLPYASSVGSVAIRPTEEGAIKHQALMAMEQQTDMQLDQIRQQIELLARQAQELRKRKELSLMIYNATLRFVPVIGQVYYLYEKKDGSHALSLVSPREWGGTGPFKQFEAAVKLLADHTWVEINES